VLPFYLIYFLIHELFFPYQIHIMKSAVFPNSKLTELRE